ncbi:MAG: DUF4339 domain-containing protein [Verrucomicrobia bacterium]|nr:DUF4339 domain-containing protein [Verrucomicrobiota bacterium]
MTLLIHRDGQQLGPFELETVEEMIRAGTIATTDLAWCDGLTEWTPVAELLPVAATARAADAKLSPPIPVPVRIPVVATVKKVAAPARVAPVGVAPLAEDRSYFAYLRGAWKYPWQGDGLILLVAGTVFFVVLDFMASAAGIVGIFVAMFGTGYLVAYVQKIINSSGLGDAQLPNWPEFTNFQEDILSPLFQMLGVIAFCLGPGMLALRLSGSNPVGHAVSYGLLGAGFLYLPMAVLAVSMHDSLTALNPVAVVTSIARVPLDYLLACGVLLALVAIEFALEFVLGKISVPVLPGILTHFASLYFLTMSWRTVGLLHFANQRRLAWF